MPSPSATRTKRTSAIAAGLKIRKTAARDNVQTTYKAATHKARKISKTAQFHERMTKGCKVYQEYVGCPPHIIISGMVNEECHHIQCYKLAIESGAWYGYEMYSNIAKLLNRGRIAIVQLLWEATSENIRDHFSESVLHSLPSLTHSCRRDIVSTIFANNMHSLPDDYDLIDDCYQPSLATLRLKIITTAVNEWDHDTLKLCRANLPIPEQNRLSMIVDAIKHPHTPIQVLQALGPFHIDDLKNFPISFRAYHLAAKTPQFTQYLRTMGMDSHSTYDPDNCFLSAIRYGNAPLAQYWAEHGVNVAIAKDFERWCNFFGCDTYVRNYKTKDSAAQYVPVSTKMQCYDLLLSWGVPIHKHRTRAQFVTQHSEIV